MDLNPVYAEGYKNVFCPHYGTCLDYAVKYYWEHWTCQQCSHKNNQTCISDYQTSYQGLWAEA